VANQLALATLRCSRCDSRNDLLTTAVIEAARQFMAWQLRDEHAGHHGVFAEVPTCEVAEALQELRDCLSAERKARP